MEDLRKIVKRSFNTFIIIVIIIVIVLIWMFALKRIKTKEFYSANDFGIKTIYSNVDYNGNGIDDYSDFVLGARKNGDNTIKMAFKEAGYDLSVVNNYISFFLKYSDILTTDINEIGEWQPGDIVFFDDNMGIVSDKRNKKGVTFVIYDDKEEDILSSVNVKFHFRFNGEKLGLNLFE